MIALLLSLAFAESPVDPVASEERSASYVLKVASKETTADLLIDKAKELDGWFASLDDDSVSLRVPTENLEALMEYSESLGLVADRSLSSADHRSSMAELEAQIGSRRELLEQYTGLLATAKRKALLQLEREITYTIADIERKEGRLRYLRDRIDVARVDVSFRFRDRRRQATDTYSSFPWLNTLSVTRLESSLRGPAYNESKKSKLPQISPEGFAIYKKKREFRATSPDGVVVRMRREIYKPATQLSFWTEAITKHLEANGYKAVRSEELTGATWLEFVVPVGEVDRSYMVTIQPVGKQIEIIEAGGPTEAFEKHRDELLKATKAAL